MKSGQHPKFFLNFLLFILCVGILAGEAIGQQPAPGILLPLEVFTVCLALCCSILLKRHHSFTWLAVIILVFLLGICRFFAVTALSPTDISYQQGKECKITGQILKEPIIHRDSQGIVHIKYMVKCQSLHSSDSSEKLQGNLIIYAKNDSFDVNKTAHSTSNEIDSINTELYGQVGDSITLAGQPKTIHDYQNPGRLNTAMMNLAQDVRCQIIPDKYSIKINTGHPPMTDVFSSYVRATFKNTMEQIMPKADASALFAMLFGGYNGIKPELLEAFTTTGIVHILSVSGSHITLMAGTAATIGRILHLPPKITSCLSALTILLYGLLAGAVMPVVRSVIMGILTLLALTLERERDAQHILTITAFCILLYQPLSFFDISFQLSFGATAGLLYIAPIIREKLRLFLHHFVADTLSITIAAQLSVLPLLAWYFNTVSLSSLLANLIVTPIVELLIVLGLTAGLMTVFIPVVGQFVFIIASLGLGLVYELSRFIASLPGSKIYIPVMSWYIIIPYYAFLIFLCTSTKQRDALLKYLTPLLSGKTKPYTGCFAAIIISVAGFYLLSPSPLQVHFIDVGQGDSILVITPHKRAFMIDTGGNRSSDFDIGKRVDVPYLLHYGVRQLDYIFLTHAHDDHAKGTAGIVDSLPVGAILTGHEGTAVYQKTFGKKYPSINQELIAPMHSGSSMEIDGVTVEILYSPSPHKAETNNPGSSSEETGNEFSNLIKVSYGNASFLITGDLVKEQEAILLKKRLPLKSSVLKVAHHGSHTSSSEDFLRVVDPQWSVISVGQGNSFGHPHQDILDRIKAVTHSQILRTDKNGAIVFKTDGKTMHVSTYK